MNRMIDNDRGDNDFSPLSSSKREKDQDEDEYIERSREVKARRDKLRSKFLKNDVNLENNE